MASPTARSLAALRQRGCLAAVVEHFNPHARIRQDLFGAFDVLAIEPGQPGVLFVQCCVTGDITKRLAKLQTEPVAERVRRGLAAGNTGAVHGWALRGARGKRKVYELKEVSVTCPRPAPPARSRTRIAGRRGARSHIGRRRAGSSGGCTGARGAARTTGRNSGHEPPKRPPGPPAVDAPGSAVVARGLRLLRRHATSRRDVGPAPAWPASRVPGRPVRADVRGDLGARPARDGRADRRILS